MNHTIQAIGLYIPSWLYESTIGDKQFFDQCFETIKNSSEYKPVRLFFDTQEFSSFRDFSDFLLKQNICIVVNHDSHYFPHYRMTYPFYKKTMKWLERLHNERKICLVNSPIALLQAHDKNITKNILRKENIPVLEDTTIRSKKDCKHALTKYTIAVLKPLNSGAGEGIKLLRYNNGFEEYRGNIWYTVKIISFFKLLHIQKSKDFWIIAAFYALYSIYILCIILVPSIPFWESFFVGAFLFYIFSRSYTNGYTYRCPCMMEPYFNDDPTGFSSLRCTVIGNQVVETIKRTNGSNITSNVSRGGKAISIKFTQEQKDIAVRASQAIGADYAGVDLLTSGNITVIGEVNVGPITIFGDITDVAVGKIFAEYLLKKFCISPNK